MRYGTNCFVGRKSAIRYYKTYGYGDVGKAVDSKIASGEIVIGKPTNLLKPGDELIVIDGRYHVEEKS